MARIKIPGSTVQAVDGGSAAPGAGLARLLRIAPVATRNASLTSAGSPSESGGMATDGADAGGSGSGSASGGGGAGGDGAGGAGFLTALGRGPGATGLPVSGSIRVAGSA